MRTATKTAATAIAARIRAIAPADHHDDAGTPAGAAIEATAEYTGDGYEDEEARAAAE